MIGIIGAGAFGTALAVAFGRGGVDVRLWARDPAHVAHPALPETVTVTAEMAMLREADAFLLCIPMQQVRGFLQMHGAVLDGRPIIACCKGIDLATLQGPTAQIATQCPAATPAVLTGPSFAADIIKDLPTALTLAIAKGNARILSLGGRVVK